VPARRADASVGGNAIKYLAGVSKDIRRRIEPVSSFEDDPSPNGVKKLRGSGDYRIAMGSYRIIYVIDQPARMITVRYIRHRREAYR